MSDRTELTASPMNLYFRKQSGVAMIRLMINVSFRSDIMVWYALEVSLRVTDQNRGYKNALTAYEATINLITLIV